ncbi:tetraprenyl-beta-curcumene synthase family protein [Bacillaceae bacterium SIJ1]|uniref:tetraprenyl-beta-curcumene synthase family protein n=1 Tax=Litoribacterium kuwaitense TaxID=1398745 RepID=UPI0013EBDD38|nr:tetraprenyl-beta-curcumene synthase family protein [Litoribacterium kuwaitense]NGP44226.1 tetraprenyl-beta-curcumene synthase family protein [Litoribacterium kuwaitense]
MKTPTTIVGLMKSMYTSVFPEVHNQLKEWKARAATIPDDELREQALKSIDHKTFHCEGGAVYALLSGKAHFKECVKFIVAYQTISDYLDNLCDRSTSLDPVDFEALHESMAHALTPGAVPVNYYRHRTEQNDEGYLQALVETCQGVLARLPAYDLIADHLLTLEGYYADLQIHKHVKKEEREERLIRWFEAHRHTVPEMTWYEFSACAGSTLGIFCLASYAFHSSFTKEDAGQIYQGYFPYVQGLHILLDYFIDQEEDRMEGDLNFCEYYESRESMIQRFEHFVTKADDHLRGIPNEKFHRLVNRGLLGLYLSDDKVNETKLSKKIARSIRQLGGFPSLFFYVNGRAYRALQKNNSSLQF